jgi:hypothetical protein
VADLTGAILDRVFRSAVVLAPNIACGILSNLTHSVISDRGGLINVESLTSVPLPRRVIQGRGAHLDTACQRSVDGTQPQVVCSNSSPCSIVIYI